MPHADRAAFFLPLACRLMTTTHYDYIIAGAGCAGLGLVWKCLTGPLRHKRILILDPDAKQRDDRTWCFWDTTQPDLPCEPNHVWDHIAIHTHQASHVHPIAPYVYYHLSGKAYYDAIHTLIEEAPNVVWKHESVLDIHSEESSARVLTTGGTYQGSWIFSSLPDPVGEAMPQEHMLQHFLGYFVETEYDAFDVSQVQMMDFRVEHESDVRFFYVLPFSPRKALVEFTVFSKEPWEHGDYLPFMDQYLSRLTNSGSGAIHVERQERGVIPMSCRPTSIWRQPRVMNLGLAGGAALPGTGYAFQFIQRRNQQIVETLHTQGYPLVSPHHKNRHGFYDALLLRVMGAQSGRMPGIFQGLFRKHPVHRVLAFLSEETNLWQEIRILGSLPWPPFLRALARKMFFLPQPAKASPTPSQGHVSQPALYAHRQS